MGLKGVTSYLGDQCDSKVILLFTSLQELVTLLYLPPSLRSTKVVLRYYSQSLVQRISMTEVIGDPQEMSHRSMYGLYQYAMLTHGGLIYSNLIFVFG